MSEQEIIKDLLQLRNDLKQQTEDVTHPPHNAALADFTSRIEEIIAKHDSGWLWVCNFCGDTVTTTKKNNLPHQRCDSCGGDSWSLKNE